MSKELDKDVAIGMAIISLITLPFAVVISAFVISTLWGWFVVPLGAPDITAWHAYGLSLIIGYMQTHNNGSDDPVEAFLAAWTRIVIKAAMALGIGAIAVNHI